MYGAALELCAWFEGRVSALEKTNRVLVDENTVAVEALQYGASMSPELATWLAGKSPQSPRATAPNQAGNAARRPQSAPRSVSREAVSGAPGGSWRAPSPGEGRASRWGQEGSAPAQGIEGIDRLPGWEASAVGYTEASTRSPTRRWLRRTVVPWPLSLPLGRSAGESSHVDQRWKKHPQATCGGSSRRKSDFLGA